MFISIVFAARWVEPTSARGLNQTSPLPTPTPVNSTIPSPPLPGQPGNPIRVIDYPEQYQEIAAAVGLPVQAIQNLPPQAFNGLIKANAAKLKVNVYERNAETGEMELVVRGRPEATPTPELQAQSVGSLTPRVWLPMIAVPNPLDSNLIKSKVDLAYAALGRQYSGAQDHTRAYMKEYIGFPLWVENLSRPGDTTYPRLAGHYYQNHSQAFTRIDWYHVYETSDQYFITFEEGYNWGYGEPGLYAYRAYDLSTGKSSYQVYVNTSSSTAHMKLYLGSYLIDDDLRSRPTTWYSLDTSVTTSFPDPLPAHRYTIKHATILGKHIYDIWNVEDRRSRLATTLSNYGFSADIYNPLFGLDTGEAEDYVFTTVPYRDCTHYTFNGVGSTLPWGVHKGQYNWFTYLPYEPKECTLGIQNYLTVAMADNLGAILMAIHNLNKYNNPDRGFCKPHAWGGCTVYTPRSLARLIESSSDWNGYGIAATGKPSQYASAVRSNSFLVLETLLGYKHNDATSKQIADTLAKEILKTLWGDGDGNFGKYYGKTEDGLLLRPQFYGGQMVSWVQDVQAVLSGGVGYAYSLPPRTFLQEVIDHFNMPSEVEGVLPSNTESTATFIQAMRVYLKYAKGINYPNNELLP